MAKFWRPEHAYPFSVENPRPQCPATLDDYSCHQLLGHEGRHVHYIGDRGAVEWEHTSDA